MPSKIAFGAEVQLGKDCFEDKNFEKDVRKSYIEQWTLDVINIRQTLTKKIVQTGLIIYKDEPEEPRINLVLRLFSFPK